MVPTNTEVFLRSLNYYVGKADPASAIGIQLKETRG